MDTFQTHTMGVAERAWLIDKDGKLGGRQRVEMEEWGRVFYSDFSPAAPGYLVATFPDEGGEFGHHQVHTFQAGLFQFADLFFHYSLKGQIRGEQPRSEGSG